MFCLNCRCWFELSDLFFPFFPYFPLSLPLGSARREMLGNPSLGRAAKGGVNALTRNDKLAKL